jgi:hypothetical protein
VPERDEDHDDFWGEDDSDRPRRRQRVAGGDGASDARRKAIPIIAAAAALLLIVVIFVAARSSDDKKSGSGASTDAAGTTLDTGNQATNAKESPPTTAVVKVWTNNLGGAPPIFRDPAGKPTDIPKAGADAKPGVYFWETYDGWHVRVVKGDGIGEVRGFVTGKNVPKPTTIDSVTGADRSIASVQDGNVAFDIPAEGTAVVGVNFTLGGYTNQSVLTLNGPNGPIDTSKIYLGSGSAKAMANPQSFEKVTKTKK